jgi:protein-tyrosine phosphatase
VALDGATDQDLATLVALGVHTIFDLRTVAERQRRPDRLPTGSRHVALDLLTDSGEADPAAVFELLADPPRASIELADGAMERFYVATYHDVVRLPSARAGYARLYRSIAAPTARPALMHCMTGKDRTGWAAAALLLFLGVGPDAVMRDYLISDVEVRRAYQPMCDDFVARGGSRDVIEPMMGCKPSFLDAAIDAMLADYGSIDRYFAEGLGLEEEVLEALRDRFLE